MSDISKFAKQVAEMIKAQREYHDYGADLTEYIDSDKIIMLSERARLREEKVIEQIYEILYSHICRENP